MNPVQAALGRPIRLAVVGGAAPSLIGPVHRTAARLDGRFDIVAGVLSSNAEKARREGASIGLAPERSYGAVEDMIAAEAIRADGIEAVAVMTPNDSHFRIARAAIAAGLDVICDKPLTNDPLDAEALATAAAGAGVATAVTHNYSGYPMIRQARALVEAGAVGELRLIQVEYLGAGLALRVEDMPDAARRWRLDPAKGGPSLVLADIGTHAHHLACYVSGQNFAALSAEVGTLMPGRRVHDYAQVRFTLRGGARGSMSICQGAAGVENHILVRVFGSTGHIEWRHREHNHLLRADTTGMTQIYSRGSANLEPAAKRATRIPRAGHPEGFHEAFANIYADFAEAVVARRLNQPLDPLAATIPGFREGAEGVRFVAAALRSQDEGQRWVTLG
ncbi:MAG: Gfo/Idh/MocA family oxidoreductase [Alphaproteobacteria bacterium]|nr:Gfo/Idh/MocA family oxidoreductase [Alphaproteobacteria bacterium]